MSQDIVLPGKHFPSPLKGNDYFEAEVMIDQAMARSFESMDLAFVTSNHVDPLLKASWRPSFLHSKHDAVAGKSMSDLRSWNLRALQGMGPNPT